MLTKSISDTYKIIDKIPLEKESVIALIGPLGAGKTTLVKGIAQKLKIEDHVVSPTFTIINEYNQGIIPLFHIDLYRINHIDEIIETGLSEYLPSPKGITAIEWADKFPSIIPKTALKVFMKIVDENIRDIKIED